VAVPFLEETGHVVPDESDAVYLVGHIHFHDHCLEDRCEDACRSANETSWVVLDDVVEEGDVECVESADEGDVECVESADEGDVEDVESADDAFSDHALGGPHRNCRFYPACSSVFLCRVVK